MSENEALFTLTPEEILTAAQDEDANRLRAYFRLFTDRSVHIGELGIDRNTFLGWEKAGLFPYERTETNGWRRFSFVEGVWIKIIEELRSLGTPLERIRSLKEWFWPSDNERLQALIEKSLGQYNQLTAGMSERVIQGIKAGGAEGFARFVREEQFCLLLIVIFHSILYGDRYILRLGKEGAISLFPLPTRPGREIPELPEAQAEIFSSACILVNLWPLIEGLALGDALSLEEEVLLHVVTPVERQILETVRKGQYQEIIIEMDGEGEPSHIRLKKSRITQEVIKKLHAYTKKGEFKSVQFKTRDGLLIQFEETDVIKLEPKRGRGRPRKNK